MPEEADHRARARPTTTVSDNAPPDEPAMEVTCSSSSARACSGMVPKSSCTRSAAVSGSANRP